MAEEQTSRRNAVVGLDASVRAAIPPNSKGVWFNSHWRAAVPRRRGALT
ncbi:hypothetical protein PP714_10580 [Lacticaseibacillus paracasei]|nr:hypothetical protein [Lacticaseibacillus paracasei]